MTTTPTASPEADDHGFELRRRPKWIWPALGLVVVVVAAVAVKFVFFGETKSANEIAGATLVVATNEGNAAEQSLIEYIAKDVAPRHGIKVAFRGLADSNTINRAVSDGEVAGTIYQHKLWLSQVLEANPDFRETAATPVFRWGFGIWSDKYTDPSQLPDGANVSLYSDPANEAQGLWLLERAVAVAPGSRRRRRLHRVLPGRQGAAGAADLRAARAGRVRGPAHHRQQVGRHRQREEARRDVQGSGGATVPCHRSQREEHPVAARVAVVRSSHGRYRSRRRHQARRR
jgi:hypothetical protein